MHARPLPGRDVLVNDPSQRALRIHVAEIGRLDTELPILLLAEPPATAYLWHAVARELGKERRCFAPDLVGCGASERPAGRGAYAIGAQAAMLEGLLDALLDQLAVPRVAVAASGIAGAVAVALAARAPERVAALILAGSPLHADSWPTASALPLLPPGAGELVLALMRVDRPHARRRLAALLATDDGGDLEPYLDALREPGAARAALKVLRSVDMATAGAALELVATAPPPTLVLWGESDRQLSLAYARRVADQLGARLSVILGAGHLVVRDRPQQVAAEIAGFLGPLRRP